MQQTHDPRKSSNTPGGLFVDWDHLSVPAWIIGPDSRVHYLNSKAEELLGVKAGDSIGKTCREVVNGAGPGQKSLCGSECALLGEARRGDPPKPRTIQVGGTKDRPARWVQVMPMTMTAPDGSGPYVVLMATDVERWRRIEGYVKKIAARERPTQLGGAPALTRREEEVLGMLADDLSQKQIAAQLHVSYTTVRTHVQRILSKLGVHSIQAAVACHLLRHRSGTG